MNLNTLSEFRQQVYVRLESRADALFSLCDALLSEAQARSLPYLSLSLSFERKWPSVYAALADGAIDIERLRALCVCRVLAELPADAVIWIAVDSSSVEWPEAAISEDRGYVHVANLPLADKPVSEGWSFSVVALLPETASSWKPILEVQRIASTQTAIGVAIAQLRLLQPLLEGRRVIVLADRWYGTPEMLWACRKLGYSVLIRLKSNRKLYRQPVRVHQRGAPPKDGPPRRRTRLAALGGQRPCADAPASPSGHAHAFVAAWHTSASVPSTRKIVWARQRLLSNPGTALSNYLKNGQQEENERQGHGSLRWQG